MVGSQSSSFDSVIFKAANADLEGFVSSQFRAQGLYNDPSEAAEADHALDQFDFIGQAIAVGVVVGTLAPHYAVWLCHSSIRFPCVLCSYSNSIIGVVNCYLAVVDLFVIIRAWLQKRLHSNQSVYVWYAE